MIEEFKKHFTPYKFEHYGLVRLPEVIISNEEKQAIGAPLDCSNYEFLRLLTYEGFKKKVYSTIKEEAAERVKKELEVISRLGFVDYILLTWKINKYADAKKISRGVGRGSAAGCYIFYLIEVTKVNSLKYNLLFERFISEARAKSKVIDGVMYIDGKSAPDVDSDFSMREPIVEYLKELYPNRVCKIGNISTLSGKALIKECYKIVTGGNEDDAKKAANMIPKIFGVVMDIEKAYYGEKNDKGEWKTEPVPEFVVWADEHWAVFETALKLRDLAKNRSVHASGYIVAHQELDKFIPCELVASEEEEGKKDIVSIFTMDIIAQLTVKQDILKVRCCSVIEDVSKEVGIDVDTIDVDNDPAIYDNLQNNLAARKGLFQIEAHTVGDVVSRVLPKNLSELSDCVAIGRPGALSYLDSYVKNDAKSVNPLFDPILGKTRNLPLFQEQMMQLLNAVGFTLVEADTCRRIVGKKKREEVDEWEQKIYDKCKKNGFSEDIGKMLWKILKDSADYSFNACLSPDTMIENSEGEYKPMYSIEIGDKIKGFDKQSKKVIDVTVKNIYPNNKEIYEIELEDGRKIKASMKHKFLCEDGSMKALEEILVMNSKIICE